MNRRLLLLLLSLGIPAGGVAAATSDAAAGQALAADLCALSPEEAVEMTGKVVIRQRGQPTREIPFLFKVIPGQPRWTSIYQTLAGDTNLPPRQLLIHRSPGSTNHYVLVTAAPGSSTLNQTNAAIAPTEVFAGSDFYIGDLGLEFLRWREQKLLRKEMTMSRPCRVLESRPGTGDAALGYSRVVSWIDNETGGILRAQAYDAGGKLLKEFELNSFKKVAGQYRLEEMEMRNVQTRSRTRLIFDVGQ
ncbi:MAG: outer membrane lipoprotein-sorting protein [Verrucomicrobiae bacterium]|nr:outer membrane lipoprotein-sorting protein [Verrucomicrobiae bacterium]